jgi:peptidoglycan/xylan/chitin deacetylase (PgdA/CDA1 family)
MNDQAPTTADAARDHDQPKCLAVMYHYVHFVRPLLADDIVTLGPRDFETQLDALCARLEPIDWPTLWAWSQGRGRIPRRCFLLTFDDGLADHAEVVVPILERRGLRGVFFVAGEVLTRQRTLSAHAVHLLIANLGCERFEHELIRWLTKFDGEKDWMGKVDAAAAAAMYHYESPDRARLKYLLTMVLPTELRRTVIEALFEVFVGSGARWSQHWYLGWDELADMQSKGHTIGGHGYAHEPLARLTPGRQERDINSVASVLNEGIGHDLRPFSYPYGSFDQRTCKICREAGFVQAFTTERALITAQHDPMQLPRVDTIYVDDQLKERDVTCTQT